MVRRIATTRSLRLSARAPDLDNLPLRLNLGNGWGLGLFLMLFAAFWGGMPGYFLFSEWETLEEGAYFALLFPVIGTGLFAFGFYSLFSRQRVVVDREAVSGERRSLFGGESWQVPLRSYRGVLLKTVRVRRNKSTVTAHAVFLEHDEEARSVPLYVSTRLEESRRQWERAAKAFRLDALEETADGVVARRIEDLDKSVRELAAEGKLDIDFEARPPPPALAARYEGDKLVVTTTGPTVPGKAALAIGLVSLVLIVLFSVFGVIAMAVIVGWLLWDRHAREQLTIDREGVSRQWLTPWRAGKVQSIPAERIEAVKLAPLGNRRRPHLAVVSDDLTIRFAGGRPQEALEWARQAVLAHVAK